jgi:hypothetical protein
MTRDMPHCMHAKHRHIFQKFSPGMPTRDQCSQDLITSYKTHIEQVVKVRHGFPKDLFNMILHI